MCPNCKAVWLEDAEFIQKKSVLYFACYNGSEDLRLNGLGKAFTRSDAINIAINGLREDNEQFDLFVVQFLTKEKFEELQKEQQLKASALRGVSLLAALAEFNLGEVLKDKPRGRKPRKE